MVISHVCASGSSYAPQALWVVKGCCSDALVRRVRGYGRSGFGSSCIKPSALRWQAGPGEAEGC